MRAPEDSGVCTERALKPLIRNCGGAGLGAGSFAKLSTAPKDERGASGLCGSGGGAA